MYKQPIQDTLLGFTGMATATALPHRVPVFISIVYCPVNGNMLMVVRKILKRNSPCIKAQSLPGILPLSLEVLGS